MKLHNILIIIAIFAVSGCGGTTARQIIGIDRKSPDAFSVSTHAPLEIPRDLSNLPEPQPGAPRPQEVSAQQQARSAVFLGNEGVGASYSATGENTSAAESALLSKVGQADPNVRAQVNKEAARDADKQSGPLDWMLFWRKNPQPGVAVDAAAEAERLKKAREEGQSATATPTPVVEDSGRLGVPKEIQ